MMNGKNSSAEVPKNLLQLDTDLKIFYWTIKIIMQKVQTGGQNVKIFCNIALIMLEFLRN